MKDAVNNELRNTKNELTRVKAELNQERQQHALTNKHLNIGSRQMKQLNRVSVLALDEFNDLRKKYEIEADCRRKAEDYATEVVQKQHLNDKKSRIINEEADKDAQLKTFMDEIDDLHALSEQQRKESEAQIKELEEELQSSKSTETMKSLEEKLSVLMEQLDIAQKQLVVSEACAHRSETEARNLYTRLALAERDGSSKMSSLPPPPPPPPPPITAPVIRKFITRIGKRKKGAPGPEKEEDPRIEAMADMIERIKNGVKLRSVASLAKINKDGEEDKSAMGELAGLLSNMRQGRTTRQESLDVVEEEKTPEFVQVKLKKASSIMPSSVDRDDGLSSELQKKLEKQKSVADGIGEEHPNVGSKHTALAERQAPALAARPSKERPVPIPGVVEQSSNNPPPASRSSKEMAEPVPPERAEDSPSNEDNPTPDEKDTETVTSESEQGAHETEDGVGKVADIKNYTSETNQKSPEITENDNCLYEESSVPPNSPSSNSTSANYGETTPKSVENESNYEVPYPVE